jgi:hypothetical protein
MTVEMGIRHRDSGEYEVVSVATSQGLPACERLGLELVPLFAGGALTIVPSEVIPRLVAGVEQLRAWAVSQPDGDYLAERCAAILAAFARTDPAACEYDFG